jgi:rubrerythrin
MKPPINELLCQMLETELGGIQVYTTALECARNPDLKEEWNTYLEQTTRHVEIVGNLFQALGLDPEHETPGRQVVRHLGEGLVKAIELAKTKADANSAEIVACECVVLAETKDHLNWHLLAEYAETAKGKEAQALKDACAAVEDQEDEHVYHSKGWCRELWLASLGMKAVLPPPEEEQHVKTAMAAARAEQGRKRML